MSWTAFDRRSLLWRSMQMAIPRVFRNSGCRSWSISIGGFAGPLAGVLAGLDWAAETVTGCAWLLSAPTDAPFLPEDLVSRLHAETETGAEIAVASSGGRSHPVAALWPIWLRVRLRHALESGIRKVEEFTKDYRVHSAHFAADPVDPFFNLNRPEDLEAAERALLLQVALNQPR